MIEQFNILIDYIQRHQLQPKHQANYYLGDRLAEFLQETQQPFILKNPIHSMALKPLGNETWLVYDPNSPHGIRPIRGFNAVKEAIHNALGALVSVESSFALPLATIENSISNPNVFLEQGGLLALVQASSDKEVHAMLAQIPTQADYPLSALNGLLLRNLDGIPAWVIALSSPIPQIVILANALLQQFIEKNPNYKAELQKSIEVMNPDKRHDFIAHLKGKPYLAAFIPLMRTTQVKVYERLLQSNKPLQRQEPLRAYCKQCLSLNPVKKRLIQLNSAKELTGMRFALEQYAKDMDRPVFYIHSPEELVCNHPFIKREGNRGIPHDGIDGGGPLFNFLKINKDKEPILIINYDHFEASDIANLNAVLAKNKPMINSTVLPEKTLIVGLMNINKADSYQGSDFYRRFDVHERCPVDSQELLAGIPKLPIVSGLRNPDNAINLFKATNWKEHLRDSAPDAKGLTFEEGALEAALKKGPIEIHNGLWKLEDFTRFWQEAVFHGKLRFNERKLDIPADLQLIPQEGYDWEKLAKQIVAQVPDPYKL